MVENKEKDKGKDNKEGKDNKNNIELTPEQKVLVEKLQTLQKNLKSKTEELTSLQNEVKKLREKYNATLEVCVDVLEIPKELLGIEEIAKTPSTTDKTKVKQGTWVEQAIQILKQKGTPMTFEDMKNELNYPHPANYLKSNWSDNPAFIIDKKANTVSLNPDYKE